MKNDSSISKINEISLIALAQLADRKHVRIDPSLQSGSYYYNYKGTFSIVLIAVMDANLRYVDSYMLVLGLMVISNSGI